MADEKINPFRSPETNVRYLKALFYELADTERKNVLYTLKDVDHMGYPSLYRLYMEMDDFTEYNFANKYFEGWEHWEMVCNTNWFKPLITRWRKELDLRLKAKALDIIKNEAAGNGRNALSAAKYLVERGWEAKPEKLTKAQTQAVQKAADDAVFDRKELEDAAKRIGLN